MAEGGHKVYTIPDHISNPEQEKQRQKAKYAQEKRDKKKRAAEKAEAERVAKLTPAEKDKEESDIRETIRKTKKAIGMKI